MSLGVCLQSYLLGLKGPGSECEDLSIFNTPSIMPNWCSNSVVFSAAEDKLEHIRNLFAEIQQKQEADNRYHLPSFAVSDGFMQDILINHNRIAFETRWFPNISLLAAIADYYNATFVSRYMEMSNGLYGEARYDYHTLTIVNLDQEDFRVIHYDKQKNGYPCAYGRSNVICQST